MIPHTLRRRLAAAAVLALPLAAAACNSVTGPTLADRQALARAKAQWEAVRPHSYSFVVGPRCYCPVAEMRITVVDGVATSRVYVENGQPVPATLFHTLDTVDAMLAHLEKAIDDGVAKLEASYDDRGVPVNVSIDYSLNVIDEEFGWVVTSFSIAP